MAPPLNTSLDPRRIEAEIARMRERESSSFGGGVKANLFNLVVVCPPGSRPDEALDALLGRRPARIIRLSVDAPGPAGAFVSGRCFPGALDRGVCLEEIDLAAGEDPLAGGVGVWTPLANRDIPTFLWITGPWTPQMQPALAHADKLIVDSSANEGSLVLLAALHRLRGLTRGRLAVADLAWSRSLPLRVAAARCFDPPAAREALDEITAVRLEGATGAEALLFFLWLAARLGWKLRDTGGGLSFDDAAGREIPTAHRHPGPLAQGVRLSFTARDAVIEAACSAADGYGCASVGHERAPWRVASDGELLLAEVDTLKQDALLGDALAVAAAAHGGGPGAVGS
jgi:hypothetical protein